MRYLGIDYGNRKIGLAFGDDETKIAAPFETIKNDSEILKTLFEIIKNESIDGVVVGVPLAVGAHHGSEQLDKTRAFIILLKDYVKIPIFEEDESYTSVESARISKENDESIDEDALAAALILQSWLNK